MKTDDISYNFNVVKVLSILMVATAHYFEGILWIAAGFGLFIFGFSSGYFTSQKYQGSYSIKKFWQAKIVRLWSPLLVIDIFLLLLFLAQHKTGIFSWQTLPSLIGMSGLLNWFNFANPSPFGSGLWFFTVLILFYACYPIIEQLNKKPTVAIIFLLASFILTTFLSYTVIMGYMLWMTIFSFILGAYWGVYGRPLSSWGCFTTTVLALSVLLSINTVIDLKQLNYPFIVLSAIGIIAFLLNKRLPNFGLQYVAMLSGIVIQIYFLHTYLFFKFETLPSVANYAVSMVVIILVSLLLGKITEKVNRVFTVKSLPKTPLPTFK